MENKVEAALCKAVALRGGMAVKMSVPGVKGAPDRLVILPGPIMFFVETKRPRGGVMLQHQIKWADRLAKLGVVVAVVKEIDEIDRLLDGIEKPAARRTLRAS